MQNRTLFQSHLNEVSWRMMFGNNFSELLRSFLDDVNTTVNAVVRCKHLISCPIQSTESAKRGGVSIASLPACVLRLAAQNATSIGELAGG